MLLVHFDNSATFAASETAVANVKRDRSGKRLRRDVIKLVTTSSSKGTKVQTPTCAADLAPQGD